MSAKPSVIATAKETAQWLESDLVMTAQIKEHIKPERLIEILGITAPESEQATLEDATDDELIEELQKRLNK